MLTIFSLWLTVAGASETIGMTLLVPILRGIEADARSGYLSEGLLRNWTVRTRFIACATINAFLAGSQAA